MTILYFMETLRLSPNTKVGKVFTQRATFEKILKPRVALIGKAKKTSKSLTPSVGFMKT